MKYVILIQSTAETGELFAAMTDEERHAAFQVYLDVEEELQRSGELLDSKAIAEREQHIVVRGVRGVEVRDAPAPQDVPVLSGYYLVDVPHLDRAAEIAARFPEAAVEGGIRVARTLTAEDFAQLGF